MTFDDPLITYDGAPTDVFFAQLLAKVEATPASTVAALQAVGSTGPSAESIAAAVWGYSPRTITSGGTGGSAPTAESIADAVRTMLLANPALISDPVWTKALP